MAVTKLYDFFIKSPKSLTLIVGLFCCFLVLSSCRKETDPGDVTILFWEALSEKDWDAADYYSIDGSSALFNKNLRSSHVQIGDINIHYDQATVKTYVSREYAAKDQSFLTYLVRIPETDQWRVDYPQTYQKIKQGDLNSLVEVVKHLGGELKIDLGKWFKGLGASMLKSIKGFFKKDKA